MTIQLRSYKEAVEYGDKKYKGGPCKNGHTSGIRYTLSGNCIECLKWKPTGRSKGKPSPERLKAIQNGEEFYFTGKACSNGHISKRYVKGSRCLECIKTTFKEKRKGRERSYSIAKYGITPDQYEKMLKSQNYVCAICKKKEKQILKGKRKPLAIDHCHITKKVRALLCANCNLGLGNFQHNEELLKAAASYCEEHK